MVRTPFKKIFSNPEVMAKMLALRAKGWSYVSLGDLYAVDYTSIYHNCKLHNINIEHPVSPFILLATVATVVKPRHAVSYEDYFKKAYPNRKWVEKDYI
jgi:hypothetical protein